MFFESNKCIEYLLSCPRGQALATTLSLHARKRSRVVVKPPLRRCYRKLFITWNEDVWVGLGPIAFMTTDDSMKVTAVLEYRYPESHRLTSKIIMKVTPEKLCLLSRNQD